MYTDSLRQNFRMFDRKYLGFQDIHFDQHKRFAMKVSDNLPHIYTDNYHRYPHTECTSRFYCLNMCKASSHIHLYLKMIIQ